MGRSDDMVRIVLDKGQTPAGFRLPGGLHRSLKDAAAANGRSMNAEIVHRLEASFEVASSLSPAIAALIDSHIEQEVQSRLRRIAAQIGGAS